MSNIRVAVISFLIILALSSGCELLSPAVRSDFADHQSALRVRTGKSIDLARINSLAVYPAIINREIGGSPVLQSEIDSLLNRYVQSELDVEVHPVKNNFKSKRLVTDLEISEHAVAYAESLNADSVLIINLNRYREKSGSRLAADRGAIVSFNLRILSVPEAKVLWDSSFFEEQKPLSEDLGRASAGNRSGGVVTEWKSARELLEQGLKETLSALAKARLEAFEAR
ncbi:MAG: hypothetical protein D6719_04305 [Candidatus Dadabacteria bacterium]|nr:MAG: hypothetical protein D6719_04305 [Candidatus Dadabacteria bacterium]